MHPPLMSSFDEEGYEASGRDGSRSNASTPTGERPEASNGNGAPAKPLPPLPNMPGERPDTVPAPEAIAAAAGAAVGLGPDVVVAVARGDASTAAK